MNPDTAFLKLLANDVCQYFISLDRPPADKVYVPVESLKPLKDNNYIGVVRFIMDYCGRKVHTVRIKFTADEKGRFIPASWKYV